MQEKNFQKNPFIIKSSKVGREWNFLNLVKNIYKNKNNNLTETSYLMMRNWVLIIKIWEKAKVFPLTTILYWKS